MKMRMKDLSILRLICMAMSILFFSFLSAMVQIEFFQGCNLATTMFGIIINMGTFWVMVNILPEDILLKRRTKND